MNRGQRGTVLRKQAPVVMRTFQTLQQQKIKEYYAVIIPENNLKEIIYFLNYGIFIHLS